MTAHDTSTAGGGDPSRALVLADTWFRVWGVVTLAGLVTTGALLAAGADAWRPVFALSHLAALLALLPLGVVLVAMYYAAARRETWGVREAVWRLVRRHRVETVLTALALFGVAVTVFQFGDGVREVRRVSNVFTVATVAALVVRYLRSGHPKALPHRVRLPLIRSGPAKPGEELTPERIKEILLEQEVERYFKSIGEKPPPPENTRERA